MEAVADAIKCGTGTLQPDGLSRGSIILGRYSSGGGGGGASGSDGYP